MRNYTGFLHVGAINKYNRIAHMADRLLGAAKGKGKQKGTAAKGRGKHKSSADAVFDDPTYLDEVVDLAPFWATKGTGKQKGTCVAKGRGKQKRSANACFADPICLDELVDLALFWAAKGKGKQKGTVAKGKGKQKSSADAVFDDPTYLDEVVDLAPFWAAKGKGTQKGTAAKGKGKQKSSADAVFDDPTYLDEVVDLAPFWAAKGKGKQKGTAAKGKGKQKSSADAVFDTQPTLMKLWTWRHSGQPRERASRRVRLLPVRTTLKRRTASSASHAAVPASKVAIFVCCVLCDLRLGGSVQIMQMFASDVLDASAQDSRMETCAWFAYSMILGPCRRTGAGAHSVVAQGGVLVSLAWHASCKESRVAPVTWPRLSYDVGIYRLLPQRAVFKVSSGIEHRLPGAKVVSSSKSVGCARSTAHERTNE